MIEEIWKPVLGYENLYEVSNCGNVRSVEHYTEHGNNKMIVYGKLLSKVRNTKNGYLYVTLSKNGKPMNRPINNKKSKAIEQVDMNGLVVSTFPSMQEVKRRLGYSPSNICLCCKGETDKAYGYKWRYKEYK